MPAFPNLSFGKCLCATIFLLLLTIPTQAAGTLDEQNYRRAFALIDAGKADAAVDLIEHGHDEALNRVIMAAGMAQPGNGYSFAQIENFVSKHPDWPGLKNILAIAEQKIPADMPSSQIIAWFSEHPPVNLAGFYRYIDALSTNTQTKAISDLIKARWIEHDFSSDEQIAFYARFGNYLTSADHRARLDRLLWANNVTEARHMYRYVDQAIEALAEARIALANQLSNAESLVARVPNQWQNDAGLLYERLRWRRKNNLDDGAIAILKAAPEHLGQPESWWEERNIMIHRAMERSNYKLAYQLSANNGLTGGKEFVQAEFLAGWLALRFLNDPESARDHFENLLQSATTPISRARGYYWLGRALEVLGEKNEAEQSYESAAALNTTFYGLIAAQRLYANASVTMLPEPNIPEPVRQKFFQRDIIEAAEHLYRLGRADHAYSFFKAAMESASQRVDFILLMELAHKLQRPDWSIKAAKAANQKNIIVGVGAFPLLTTPMPDQPDPAFTHALIRQESLFNADAGSPVGARGLMQLMPATAAGVARRVGMHFNSARLTEPEYNIKLGTAFLQKLLDNYDGSYILAAAAYNAGPGRVHEWVGLYGDPRHGKVDPIDWIELIPIYETRNYVERVMENFAVYRARLHGGKVPLTIMQDLRK